VLEHFEDDAGRRRTDAMNARQDASVEQIGQRTFESPYRGCRALVTPAALGRALDPGEVTKRRADNAVDVDRAPPSKYPSANDAGTNDLAARSWTQFPRMRHWNQVSQLKLFDSCHAILADDERGRIAYIPGFVDAETAQVWFTELRRGVTWRSQQRQMYDREVVVPRLLGHFRLDPAPNATPMAVLDAARRVVAHLGVPFNTVGLNLYRDGRDSVAPHNDHLYDIREGFPIALLSLGATRRMTIRAKAAPRRSLHVDLETGSLLVMDYATQIHYTHGVPKTRATIGEHQSGVSCATGPVAAESQ
jgi:alkylated DNA repair dioxygenase AlkB